MSQQTWKQYQNDRDSYAREVAEQAANAAYQQTERSRDDAWVRHGEEYDETPAEAAEAVFGREYSRAASRYDEEHRNELIAAWSAENGSQRLRRNVAEGIKCLGLFMDEYVPSEFPGWNTSHRFGDFLAQEYGWCDWQHMEESEHGGISGYREPKNAPAWAFEDLDKAREAFPDAKLTHWVVDPNPGGSPENHSYPVARLFDQTIVYHNPEPLAVCYCRSCGAEVRADTHGEFDPLCEPCMYEYMHADSAIEEWLKRRLQPPVDDPKAGVHDGPNEDW